MKTVTLTREQLYEQVWATPIRTLAQRYGLSDVGLAKVCQRHDIPRPPVGYWAKKDVGKAPPQPPLPRCDDPALQEIVLHDGPRPKPPAQPPEPEPAYDADVAELLRRATGLPVVSPADTLRNLHPLVQLTREGLDRATPDEHNLLWPQRTSRGEPLHVYVSKESVRRALLFMDAVVKAVERVGGRVAVVERQWRGKQVLVSFAGEEVAAIRLRERYRLKPRERDPKDPWSWRKHDHVPTGLLVLDSGPSYSNEAHCGDTERGGRIESGINDLIVRWVHAAGRARIARRDAEAAKRRHEEEERVRREREAELARRRDELRQRQQVEQAKVDRLYAKADAWHQSRQLRAYVRAVEHRAIRHEERTDEASELGQWLTWAREQADRLDPLTVSPPSVLDEHLP